MKRAVIQTALTTVAIAVLSGCATQNQNRCTAGASWSHWEKSEGGNGHWYKAVASTNGITWTEADKLARAEGGYLATITSAEENAFVFGLVNSTKFFDFSAIMGVGFGPALGGFQIDQSPEPLGGWCWGSGEPWNYSNWMSGQPDNGWGNEDRLQFVSGVPNTPAATWNDVNRNSIHGVKVGGYVVERDK